ncbi:hypothetical protein Ciccas_003585 [Cichlidogyrus casuarinus]|uniref:NAD(+) kinase n=1 Tax=Cichlidogyrus casuarinus TaxID=1844966 RepID=A0ABD2QEQ2_9PLAT
MNMRRLYSTLSPLKDFNGKKILVLSKISRLQFERQLNSSLNDAELREKLLSKGSNFDWLKLRHDEHSKYLDSICSVFQNRGHDVRIVTKSEFTQENLLWSDLVVTAGGDGTFLLGASKILSPTKPIIGINTDPSCSRGYLCLPKSYVFNLDKLVDKIHNQDFEQRLRIELSNNEFNTSKQTNDKYSALNSMNLTESHAENRFNEHLFARTNPEDESCNWKFYHDRTIVKDNHPDTSADPVPFTKEEVAGTVILPVRALNEVFVGEALSARVSYYEISFNNEPKTKQKSSGLTISTGTGSTSWCFNISGLHYTSLMEVFQILLKCKPQLDSDRDFSSVAFAKLVTEEYNAHLAFDPGESKMAFTVRDPVRNSIFSADNVRGYAEKLVSFSFNRIYLFPIQVSLFALA